MTVHHWFRDGARILEDVLDCRTHLVGIDGDDLIDGVLDELERCRADLCDRHALGEHPDLIQHHTLAGFHRGLEAGGIFRLDSDYPDPGRRYFT